MTRSQRWQILGCVTAIFSLAPIAPTLAHGAAVQAQTGTAVQIQANYDTGEPMIGAQVTVYAPEDPAQPWLTGITDEQGHFWFRPDASQPGRWDVQVRQAGHGEVVHVNVDAAASNQPSPAPAMAVTTTGRSGYTLPQILLMSAAGIWGFVGTALFFSRK